MGLRGLHEAVCRAQGLVLSKCPVFELTISQRLLHTCPWGQVALDLPPSLGRCSCDHAWHSGHAQSGLAILESPYIPQPFTLWQPTHPTSPLCLPHHTEGPNSLLTHHIHSVFDPPFLTSLSLGTFQPPPLHWALSPRPLTSQGAFPGLLLLPPVLISFIALNTRYLNHLFMVSITAW